jgi:hypothetical protein
MILDAKSDLGAKGDGATDDTAALQAGLNALVPIHFPDGVYLHTGLVIPAVATPVGVRLFGDATPPMTPSVIGPMPAPQTGAILLCTSPGPGLSVAPSGQYDGFSLVTVELERLLFRSKNAPQGPAVDLRNAAGARLAAVVADAGVWDVSAIVQPTNPNAIGFALPANNNGAYTRIEAALVIGYYVGFLLGEHTDADQLAAFGCVYAAQAPNAYHPSIVKRLLSVHCPYGLAFVGGAGPTTDSLDVLQAAIEHASDGSWRMSVADVYDPGQYARGSLRWKVVTPGVGVTTDFRQTGGTLFECTPIDAGGMPPQASVIIDDGQPGYSRSGAGWQTWMGGGGYYADSADYTTAAGTGQNKAAYTFSGLTPAASYAVSACWGGYSAHADNTPYTITANGLTQTVRVNQQVASSGGPVAGGVTFQPLATVTVGSDGTITVAVSDAADAGVVADAVMVSAA